MRATFVLVITNCQNIIYLNPGSCLNDHLKTVLILSDLELKTESIPGTRIVFVTLYLTQVLAIIGLCDKGTNNDVRSME